MRENILIGLGMILLLGFWIGSAVVGFRLWGEWGFMGCWAGAHLVSNKLCTGSWSGEERSAWTRRL